MNAKRMGLLASLAICLTLTVGAFAGADTYCVPTGGAGSTTGCSFVPISSSAYFQSTYAGTIQNGIFSAGAISDFGTFLSANLVNLFILAIVIVIVFMIWDRVIKK